MDSGHLRILPIMPVIRGKLGPKKKKPKKELSLSEVAGQNLEFIINKTKSRTK